MAAASHIVTSTVRDRAPARLDGIAVNERSDEVVDAAQDVLGAGTALFSTPEFGFSRARNAPVTTWYSALDRPLRPLPELPAHERGEAETRLRKALAALSEGLAARERPLIETALNIPDIADVFSDGDVVVLTNWGVTDAPFEGRRDAALGNALAPYLPDTLTLRNDRTAGGAGELPPMGSSAASAGVVAAAGVAAGPAAASSGGPSPTPGHVSAAPIAGGGGSDGPPPHFAGGDEEGRGRGALVALAASVVILALFLGYLLWPGTLVYLEHPEAERIAERRAIDRAGAEALRQRVVQLREGLSGDVCVADAAALDAIAGIAPLGIGSPGTAAGEGTADPAAPGSDLPSIPRTDVPTDAPADRDAAASPPPRTASLVTDLIAGTVFVVGPTANGITMGSGIVVGEGTILTNAHVVSELPGPQVTVINEALGRAIPARVVATSYGGGAGGADFALLAVEPDDALQPLPLASGAERLDRVIAAGFPTAVISSDENFAAAVQRQDLDGFAAIQTALTSGEITALQRSSRGVGLVVHSAPISRANSGGPLTDACGRVIGVNTFGRDAGSGSFANYALAVSDAAEFLRTNGIAVELDGSPCAAPEPRPLPSIASAVADAQARPGALPAALEATVRQEEPAGAPTSSEAADAASSQPIAPAATEPSPGEATAVPQSEVAPGDPIPPREAAAEEVGN